MCRSCSRARRTRSAFRADGPHACSRSKAAAGADASRRSGLAGSGCGQYATVSKRAGRDTGTRRPSKHWWRAAGSRWWYPMRSRADAAGPGADWVRNGSARRPAVGAAHRWPFGHCAQFITGYWQAEQAPQLEPFDLAPVQSSQLSQMRRARSSRNKWCPDSPGCWSAMASRVVPQCCPATAVPPAVVSLPTQPAPRPACAMRPRARRSAARHGVPTAGQLHRAAPGAQHLRAVAPGVNQRCRSIRTACW